MRIIPKCKATRTPGKYGYPSLDVFQPVPESIKTHPETFLIEGFVV